MSPHSLNKLTFHISGMHCSSCEVLIEHELKQVDGVESVKVNHVTGKAELHCSKEPNIEALQNAIRAHGYSISQIPAGAAKMPKNTKIDYLEIGALFLIIAAGYVFLRQLNLVPKIGISENMSYGVIFLIGLVAALSTCIAVTGGLLLAVATKYNEARQNLSTTQKIAPHIGFNLGRIASYTIFGGLIGALGSALTFSPKINGLVTIAASAVMVLLGLQLLHLFPSLKKFYPKMPKVLSRGLYEKTGKNYKFAPFFIGASTFFLPCGFTQALQLYVLSKGSALQGALIMLIFSLGTLPALLSLGIVSSFGKGAFQRYFLKTAGIVVILLGIFNINNGLTLTGHSLNFNAFFTPNNGVAQASDTNVQLIGGKQIARMKIIGLDYYPHQFSVMKGVPVEWHIDGADAEGCAQVITAPTLGITEYISKKREKVISFTPATVGLIPFSCTMGMTTRSASFIVTENTNGVASEADTNTVTGFSSSCNPEFADCLAAAQQLSMEISEVRGFYPNEFTVKKDVPVELTIDDQVALSGCMSVMIIPDYDVATPLKIGKNKLAFTPTRVGVVPITCSMGSPMAYIRVVD